MICTNAFTQANPLQAALASGASFIFGGILPILVAYAVSVEKMVLMQYLFAILFLTILGTLAAKTGGSSLVKGILRITFWGTLAMGLTALIGHFFGVSLA